MKQTAHARGSGRKWYVVDRAGKRLTDEVFKSKNLARGRAAGMNSGAAPAPAPPPPAPREELFDELVDELADEDQADVE